MKQLYTHKKGMGVTVKMGIWQKRIWFEIEDCPLAKEKFEKLIPITNTSIVGDFREYIRLVETIFELHGFSRIPK